MPRHRIAAANFCGAPRRALLQGLALLLLTAVSVNLPVSFQFSERVLTPGVTHLFPHQLSLYIPYRGT